MRWLAIPSVLGALLFTAPAWAQHDPAAAESLFRDAKAAAQRGDFKTACAQFAESQRLDPAPGTLLNLADCEDHLGAVASAWEHFAEARDGMPKGDDRLPYAERHIAALEKRVPHLVIRLPPGAPPGTKVMRGSVEVGAAALGVPIAVDPGATTLTATPPDGSASATTVTIAEGETRDVTLTVTGPAPAPGPGAAPAPAASPLAAATDAPPGDLRRTLGWIVGGVGVAGLALGAVTGVMAMGDASTVKRDCGTGGACKDQAGVDAASAGKTASLLSTAGFIGGAALVGGGLVLIVTGGSSGATAVGVAPIPGGAGVGISRAF